MSARSSEDSNARYPPDLVAFSNMSSEETVPSKDTRASVDTAPVATPPSDNKNPSTAFDHLVATVKTKLGDDNAEEAKETKEGEKLGDGNIDSATRAMVLAGNGLKTGVQSTALGATEAFLDSKKDENDVNCRDQSKTSTKFSGIKTPPSSDFLGGVKSFPLVPRNSLDGTIPPCSGAALTFEDLWCVEQMLLKEATSGDIATAEIITEEPGVSSPIARSLRTTSFEELDSKERQEGTELEIATRGNENSGLESCTHDSDFGEPSSELAADNAFENSGPVYRNFGPYVHVLEYVEDVHGFEPSHHTRHRSLALLRRS
jgi:hypothetical protein